MKTEKIVLKELHKDQDCNCFFCSVKCPECGSTSIWVKFTVSYEFENDEIDEIDISRTEDHIELHCKDCGEWNQRTVYQRDKRLDKLFSALNKAMDLPGNVSVSFDNETGKTNVTNYFLKADEG